MPQEQLSPCDGIDGAIQNLTGDESNNSFVGFMPALDLAVALRVIGAGAHVRHAAQTNEALELARDELRAIVADDLSMVA